MYRTPNFLSILSLTYKLDRQMGGRARHQSSVLFTHHYYDSLHVPKRLELMYKMQFHRGCVNALSFNSSGSRLASGSDDFKIAVWDWAREKALVTFYSGHRNNVFQVGEHTTSRFRLDVV